jgi:SAM-dependent methyltransferase
VSTSPRMGQCQKPTGWKGRLILWQMNLHHSKLTDWGLAHISIGDDYTILDVGCGGGRTISKLAASASRGKVYGVDFSEESVAASKRTNAGSIDKGCVEIHRASVSQLPFPNAMFDIVTAVETHFWWTDLPGGVREVLRVLKPDGRLVVVAEVYSGATSKISQRAERDAAKTGMKLLGIEEHRELLADAGFSDVQVIVERTKSWICAKGKKR